MHQLKLVVLAIVLLSFTTNYASAQKGEDNLRKFGFGVALNTLDTFEVPIKLTPKFRLAPMIKVDMSSETIQPENGNAQESYDNNLGFGLGLFYTMHKKKSNVLYYVGLRFMYLTNSTSQAAGANTMMQTEDMNSTANSMMSNTTTMTATSSEKEESSRADLMFAPTFGGEYFFSSRFSLGVEFAINILATGDTDNGDTDKKEDTKLDISTSAAIMARLYF